MKKHWTNLLDCLFHNSPVEPNWAPLGHNRLTETLKTHVPNKPVTHKSYVILFYFFECTLYRTVKCVDFQTFGEEMQGHIKNLDIHSDLTDREGLCSNFTWILSRRRRRRGRGFGVVSTSDGAEKVGPCERRRLTHSGEHRHVSLPALPTQSIQRHDTRSLSHWKPRCLMG